MAEFVPITVLFFYSNQFFILLNIILNWLWLNLLFIWFRAEQKETKNVEKEVKDEAKKVEKSPPKPTNEEPAKETSKGDVKSGKVETQYAKLSGLKSTGQTIDLSQFNKPKKDSSTKESEKSRNSDSRKKRKRISKVDGSKWLEISWKRKNLNWK